MCYLISFEYYKYEGAYEWQNRTMLVMANSYIEAVNKLQKRFKEIRNISNETIE